MSNPLVGPTQANGIMGVLKESGAPYLSAIFLTVVAAQLAQYLSPTDVWVKGQPAAVILNFTGFGVAFVLWWLYRPGGSWPPVFAWLVAAWVVLWAVTVGLSVLHGDLFTLTAFLVPAGLVMIWLKKPSLNSIFSAGDAFAFGLIAIDIASQLLDFTGIRASNFEGWSRIPGQTQVVEFAYRNFGALFGHYTGPLARWMGPFGNVNLAGPIGAFLFVYALLRPGRRRVLILVAGALIVVGSDSRTSILSCAAGVAALIAIAPKLGSFRTPRWLRIAAPTTVAAAFVGYIAVIDPTLNQRTPVWDVFFSTWRASPVTGVGASGIQTVIESGTLQAWANHGHSIFIDPLTRFGIVGLLAVMAVIVASAVIATRVARVGFAAPAVLLITFLADGFSEDLVDWRYLGVQAVPLTLAVMLGGAALSRSKTELGVNPSTRLTTGTQ